MAITFKKRQKEMKRQEKQRAKAERRAQKKLDRQAGIVAPSDDQIDIQVDTPQVSEVDTPEELPPA